MINGIVCFFTSILLLFASLFGIENSLTGEYIRDGRIVYSIDKKSEAFVPPENVWGNGTGYPSIIETRFTEGSEGELMAAFSVYDSGKSDEPSSIRILKSNNSGNTWNEISRVYETFDTSIEACWNACLLELPAQIGQYPAGTILLAGVSIDSVQSRKSQIALWKSADSGKTWEEISIISTGGGTGYGVWEPNLFFENGRLYCFYADDRGDGKSSPDQKIVCQYSSDLLGWSNPEDVVVSKSFDDRPGMPVVTKMGNGKYFLTYEYGMTNKGYPIYFKTANDICNWNAESIGNTLATSDGYTIGSAPYCLWISSGGDCGTLFVTGKYGTDPDNKILVSYDYGNSFHTIRNPLPYENRDGLGYHAALCFSADGHTLYYMNTVEYNDVIGKIEFARIWTGTAKQWAFRQ